jgi:hypothetical protein
MIQIQHKLQQIILEKEKSVFYSQKMKENPSLFQEQEKSFMSHFTSFQKKTEKEESVEESTEASEISREEFIETLLKMESNQGRNNHKNLLIEEISNEWKEFSNKLKYNCKFDFKFEPDKYRVGSHSFRYTYNKNELAWNTALKFLFNNAKKLIMLQERVQSLEIFSKI